MIRKMQNIDIDRVADIWLKTNLKAHYFIPEQYWTSNYESVKEMMSQAEVYVYEDDKMIQGFVGLSNEYMEGIFVSDEMQSCGIGKLLLEYIKNKKVRLRLNVYQKNALSASRHNHYLIVKLHIKSSPKIRFLFLLPQHCVFFFTSSIIESFALNIEPFSLVKRDGSGILLVYV